MGQLFDDLPPNLLDNIDLYVFDFDCTITNYPLRGVDVQKDYITKYIDVDLFKAWVEYLNSNNIKVAVASYGRKSTILYLLQHILGPNIFDEYNVITPKDMLSVNGIYWKENFLPPRSTGLNKSHMLMELSNRYNISPSKIHLLDDNLDNIYHVKSKGFQA